MLARIEEPGNLRAVLRIPETQARDLTIGQAARIDTRNGIVAGRAGTYRPRSTGGRGHGGRHALEGELPRGARADLSVDGTIEVERLDDVLYVGRPAYAHPESSAGLWRVSRRRRAPLPAFPCGSDSLP
jgi:HlyD family secretion protein